MSERINNLATIEAIAERFDVNVSVSAQGFGNRRVIELYGPNKENIEKALAQIHGYQIVWRDEAEGKSPLAYLYSNRTNWAEAGF
jgi:hypothetical protein